jgi:3-(3-hydroxy-phenyl)propionate hydroxylase
MDFTPRHYPYRALDSSEHEVLVAGAGPVGLAAALGLGRRGVKVTLLDQDDSVCSGSRAICLSRHSLEVLDRLGAGPAVSARALGWTTGRSYYRDQLVLEFDMPHSDGDPHPPMVNISQSAAEQVLVDAVLAEPNCQIAWRHKVEFVTPRQDRVEVTVDTPRGLHDLTARWLVAADGARSTVREDMGLRLRGTSYAACYLIADIHWESDLAAKRRVWFDPPASPGQTVMLHRQPDDIWRFDCQLPLDADPFTELEPERLRQRIATHMDWLGSTVPWTIEWTSCYSARAQSLDDYVHGRVVFAGDAAHLVPVLGARGLNSGFEDADTLAWMLPLVAGGAASPGLLRAYSAERRDAWRQNISHADLSTQFMSPGSEGYRLVRDAVLGLAPGRPELGELINPRQTAATRARNSPLTIPAPNAPSATLRPGDPLPDVPVRVAGRLSGLHAERGPDFTLLTFGEAGALAGADALHAVAGALRRRLAPAVGVRILAVGAAACGAGVTVIEDGDGQVAGTLGAAPGEVLVVRPDGLILARWAEAIGDPGRLADHVLGAGGARGDGEQGGGYVAGGDEVGLSHSEDVWRAVSEGLDAVAAQDREAFLTRLVLLLALQAPAGSLPALIREARQEP